MTLTLMKFGLGVDTIPPFFLISILITIQNKLSLSQTRAGVALVVRKFEFPTHHLTIHHHINFVENVEKHGGVRIFNFPGSTQRSIIMVVVYHTLPLQKGTSIIHPAHL